MPINFGFRQTLAVVAAFGVILQSGLQAGTAEPETSAVPKTSRPFDAAHLPIAITRGVDFLVKEQNKNGSWGSATRTKDLNIYAPVPGAHHAFRTATTSLCIMALVESGDRRSEVTESIERGEKWLFDELPRLRRATGDALYNVWGHAYSIQALVQLHQRLPPDDARRKRHLELVRQQIDLLQRYSLINGGWGYYDFNAQTKQPSGSPTSFTTGTVLVALNDARKLGIELPEKMVAQAIASIERQKLPDFSYAYGE